MIKVSILQQLQLKAAAGKQIWLAYSGGLDSTVLLHLLAHSAFRDSVCALHINHGLSAHATLWADHCAAVCKGLGIEFFSEKVELEALGKGIEAAARQARYNAFARYLNAGDVLLSAHHQSDQVETFLYRLARGAGLDGLSSMPTERPFAEATFLRPLLDQPRAVLERYAQEHNLSWVEDESNQEEVFDRNFLRHKVLPVLELRWPAFLKTSARAVDNLAASKALLDEYLSHDLLSVDVKPERIGESIDLTKLSAFSTIRAQALIRYWLAQKGLRPCSKAQLAQLENLTQAKDDAMPQIAWGESEFRRFNGRLYLLPQRQKVQYSDKTWGACSVLLLDDGSSLRAELGEAFEGSFVVSNRRAVSRCKPIGRAHSQTVKKLLQEYKVEPWLRPFVPYIYSGDVLIAVGDIWQCDTSMGQVFKSIQWFYPRSFPVSNKGA